MTCKEHLVKAKVIKDDEFYTKMESIESELPYYSDYFKDKTVYCNCDDPTKSNFVRYFIENFELLELKSIYATGFQNQQTDIFGHVNNSALKLKYDGHEKLITELDGDGDFRSEECIDILEQSDIVVTNPPFSLINDWFKIIWDYNKKFLVIGPILTVATSQFEYIKNRNMYVSYDRVKEKYMRPDGSEKSANSSWFTNIHQRIIPPFIPLSKQYNEVDYPTYDNLNAINVDRTQDIPQDYNGLIGVPITFLEKWNPDQFTVESFVPVNTTLQGKEVFSRILIRLNFV